MLGMIQPSMVPSDKFNNVSAANWIVPPSNFNDDAPYIILVESNTTDPESTPEKLFEVASKAVAPVRSS